MINIYKISEYILLMKSKRRHFYYINSKMKRLGWYDSIKNRILKPLRELNRVIKVLRSYNSNDQISIDADGNFNVWRNLSYTTFKDLNAGRFNSILGGMQ